MAGEKNPKPTLLEERFIAAYDEHAAPLLRHAHLRVSNKALAEDLLAETFMKTWQYLRAGREVANVKSFLYRVLDNLIVDHYRVKQRENISLEDLPESAAPAVRFEETVNVSRISLELISVHLNALPPDHKRILLYRYLDGLAIREIKELTGKSATNIYTIIHRSLKTLRKNLNRHEEKT